MVDRFEIELRRILPLVTIIDTGIFSGQFYLLASPGNLVRLAGQVRFALLATGALLAVIQFLQKRRNCHK